MKPRPRYEAMERRLEGHLLSTPGAMSTTHSCPRRGTKPRTRMRWRGHRRFSRRKPALSARELPLRFLTCSPAALMWPLQWSNSFLERLARRRQPPPESLKSMWLGGENPVMVRDWTSSECPQGVHSAPSCSSLSGTLSVLDQVSPGGPSSASSCLASRSMASLRWTRTRCAYRNA